MQMLRLLRLRRRSGAAYNPLLQRYARYSTGGAFGGLLTTKFDAKEKELSVSGQPSRVVFGAEAARDHVGAIARASGIHKMLIVRDRDAGSAVRTQYMEFLLMQAGIPCFQYTLKRDCATVKDVDDGVATAVRVGADGVVAFGGGSTMDMARAIALMLANGESAEEYVKGNMGDDLEPPVPLIIVPTVAGSGAEMSTQALVLDEDEELKLSFSPSTAIPAQAVIVDPMLALTVPLHQTIQGALTALAQCIESYLVGCHDPETDQLALQGMDLVASALAQPLVEGKVNLKSVPFRKALALASVASGLAANSSGYGAAHAIAVSMGGVSHLPHVQVAAAFVPFVFDKYEELALENEGDAFFDEIRDKLAQVNDRLATQSGFQGASVAAWMRYVSKRFDLPDTSSLELDDSVVKGLVERAAQRQDDVMESRAEDAILEKDDLRAIIENAVIVAESK